MSGRPARLFIGGIMQGSKREMAVHDQDYRRDLAAIVHRYHPAFEIVDPAALIAYLPEASLGTAIEIWRAHDAGKPVLVISPMGSNWMLWATATHLFPDIPAFERFIAEGGLLACLPAGDR
jgi:hypothetical protein